MDRLIELRYSLDALLSLLKMSVFSDVERVELKHMLSYVISEIDSYYEC